MTPDASPSQSKRLFERRFWLFKRACEEWEGFVQSDSAEALSKDMREEERLQQRLSEYMDGMK